ncbi:hypothetical protein [Streptomyces chartreusis]|uniref:hypothetical protein n=1 Tax=Streptomyces chartreusis TaxID=1969 RepID=UPI003806B779
MSASMHLTTPAGTAIGQEALNALSSALFCTSLQPADMPDPDRVRREVLHMLGTDLAGQCKAKVVQATTDHPSHFASRMAWCRQMILLVFFSAGCQVPPQLTQEAQYDHQNEIDGR